MSNKNVHTIQFPTVFKIDASLHDDYITTYIQYFTLEVGSTSDNTRRSY